MVLFPPVRFVLLAALAQSPEFRVPVREVNTPVSVFTKDGKLLDGLTGRDFQVFDNGRPQKPHVDTEFEPISLAVVVQCDRGVRRSLPEIRKVPSVIEILLLGAGGDAAVVSFNSQVKLVQPFTPSAALIDTAMRSLSASGQKSDGMDAALEAIDLLAHRPARRRRLLLMITQAGEGESSPRVREALAAAEAADVRIYALTIPRARGPMFSDEPPGPAATVELMNLIPAIFHGSKKVTGDDAIAILTGYTGGRQIAFRDLRALESAMTELGAEFHSEYHLRYSPDSSEPGWHRLRIEVNRTGAVVRARGGYFRD